MRTVAGGGRVHDVQRRVELPTNALVRQQILAKRALPLEVPPRHLLQVHPRRGEVGVKRGVELGKKPAFQELRHATRGHAPFPREHPTEGFQNLRRAIDAVYFHLG